MKRVFGKMEALFDLFYLAAASVLGILLVYNGWGTLEPMVAGVMAFVLVSGDAFHLIPRIAAIRTGKEEELRHRLGRGKQIASITMTIFYLLLWQIGVLITDQIDMTFWSNLVYFLAAVRIFLCLLPQNKWEDRYSPVNWGIWRNVPFFLQGAIVAGLFFMRRSIEPGLEFMWLAIILSFAFYFPVVIWANRNPKIGMLMLPKTVAYLWMLVMCLAL